MRTGCPGHPVHPLDRVSIPLTCCHRDGTVCAAPQRCWPLHACEDKKYHRQEFRYGAFTRTIAIPAPVQAEKATAQLKDGVLEVAMPKSAPAQVKQIPIQAS